MVALLAGTCLAAPAFAQEMWLANPGSSDFATASNWNPASVPFGIAVFGNSSITTLTFSGSRNIDTFQFNAGAPAYTFDLTSGFGLRFNGAGIVNNSSNAPTFNVASTLLEFDNASSAGNAIINLTAGTVSFLGTSTAGAAQLNAAAGTNFNFTATTGQCEQQPHLRRLDRRRRQLPSRSEPARRRRQQPVHDRQRHDQRQRARQGRDRHADAVRHQYLQRRHDHPAGAVAITQRQRARDRRRRHERRQAERDVTLTLANDVTFNVAAAVTAAAGGTFGLTGNLVFNPNSVTTFGSSTDTGTILFDPASVSAERDRRHRGRRRHVERRIGRARQSARRTQSTTVNAGATVAFNDFFAAIRNLAGAGAVSIGAIRARRCS